MSERTRAAVHDDLRRLADGIAAAHGAEAEVDIVPGYPVTVNDDGAAGFALDTAGALLGERAAVRDAGAGDGRRGLLLRAGAGSRPRWPSSARGPGPRAGAPTTRTGWSRRVGHGGRLATYAAVALRWLGKPARPVAFAPSAPRRRVRPLTSERDG